VTTRRLIVDKIFNKGQFPKRLGIDVAGIFQSSWFAKANCLEEKNKD
jgi:hypothetical protein